jgi:hypothetical protein
MSFTNMKFLVWKHAGQRRRLFLDSADGYWK